VKPRKHNTGILDSFSLEQGIKRTCYSYGSLWKTEDRVLNISLVTRPESGCMSVLYGEDVLSDTSTTLFCCVG